MKIYKLHKYASHVGCPNFAEFMDAQKEMIMKAIDENKWYMSERLGKDVGWTEAEMDFIMKHLNSVAKKFRNSFCGTKCKDRGTCDWSNFVR